MNLGTLKTHIINRTGNDAISSVITEYVNQIQYDICSRYPFRFRYSLPVSLTTIPNQNYLNPSAYLTDFNEPLDAMELTTPQKLIYADLWNVTRTDADWYKTTPTKKYLPTHYNIDWQNQRLWLYPTPDAAYPLKIRYLKGPSEISNASASLFIPSRWHQVVADGVESYIWQLDEDLRSSSAAAQRYEAGIVRMIEAEQQMPDNQPIFEGPSAFIDYSDPFLEM